MRISRIRIESESDPEPQTESESQPNPNQPNPNLDRIRIPIYRIRIETLPNRIPNRIPGSWNSIPDQIPSELSLKPNPNRTESVRPSVRRPSVCPSVQPADFRKSDKVTKKYRKIDITPWNSWNFMLNPRRAMKLRKSRISKKRHFSTCRPPSRPIFGNPTK